MEELLALSAWLLVEVVLLNTGRAVVFLATLGRWRGERLGGKEGRIHGPAGALSFKRDGQRVVTVNGLLLVGIAFYIALVFALIVGWGRAT